MKSINFSASIKNCINFNESSFSKNVQHGDNFAFSSNFDQLLIYRNGQLVWSEYIYFISDTSFKIEAL